MESSPVLIGLTVLVVFLSNYVLFLFLGWGNLPPDDWLGSLISALWAFLTFFLVPVWILKRFFRKSLRDYGLAWPEKVKTAAALTALGFLVLLPFLFFFSKKAEFINYYSTGGSSLWQFLAAGIAAPLIYYFAEEFLFRGFLFFGLLRRIGYNAFWLSSLLFAFLHVTKPTDEILFAFFSGFVFAYLSFKTKSILPAALLHFLVAVVLNLLIGKGLA